MNMTLSDRLILAGIMMIAALLAYLALGRGVGQDLLALT